MLYALSNDILGYFRENLDYIFSSTAFPVIVNESKKIGWDVLCHFYCYSNPCLPGPFLSLFPFPNYAYAVIAGIEAELPEYPPRAGIGFYETWEGKILRNLGSVFSIESEPSSIEGCYFRELFSPIIVVNQKLEPHVIFTDGQRYGNIYHYHKSESSWVGEKIDRFKAEEDFPPIPRTVSLTLDDIGRLHLVYCSEDGLKYGYYDGGGWKKKEIFSRCGGTQSIAYRGGRVHISFYDHIYGDLYYAVGDLNGFDIEPVIQQGNHGRINSISVDGNGYVYIAFSSEYSYTVIVETELIDTVTITKQTTEMAVKKGNVWEFYNIVDGISPLFTHVHEGVVYITVVESDGVSIIKGDKEK